MTTFHVNGTSVMLSEDFSSRTPDHRVRLRAALLAHIESEARRLHLSVDTKDRDSILDLSALPHIDGWGLSVSHCPDLGGFAVNPVSPAIGLDLEVASRVTARIAQRVAAFDGEKKLLLKLEESEIALSPNAFFWCAKEASLKVCGNAFIGHSPHVGQVEITALDLDARTFSARGRSLAPEDRLEIDGNFFDSSVPGLVAALATARRLK